MVKIDRERVEVIIELFGSIMIPLILESKSIR